MKHNNILFASVLAVVSVLFGCKPNNDVSVEDLAKDLTPAAFEKTESRSATTVDGLTMTVQEWTIIDKEKDLIAPSGFIYGDGVQDTLASVVYKYEMGSLCNGGLGMNYTFTPVNGGDPLHVVFWGNALIIKGDTVKDAAAPIANLKKIDANFPNHAWQFREVEYCVNYDTIQYSDTTITSKKRKDENGNVIIVKDTAITTKTVVNIDTLGMSMEHIIMYSFTRDDKFVNEGGRYEITTTWEPNADRTAMINKQETETEQFFHWGIASMTSATRFVLNIKDDKTGAIETLSVAKLDVAKGNVEIKSKAFKLADEQ